MQDLYHVPAQHNFDASSISSTSSRNTNSLGMPPTKNKQLYSNWNLFKKAKTAPITSKVLLLKAIIDAVGPVRLQVVQQSFSRACHPLQRAPSKLQHLHRADDIKDDSEEQPIQCSCRSRFEPEQDTVPLHHRSKKEGYRCVSSYVVFSRQSPIQYV